MTSGVSTETALIELRQRIQAAAEQRHALKKLLQNVEFQLESHHSSYALDNVSLSRQVDDLKDSNEMLERRIDVLRGDVETASAEHERLRNENVVLLEVVKAKESAQDDLRSRQLNLSVAERRCARFLDSLSTATTKLQQSRDMFVNEQAELVQSVGGNHDAVLSGEQRLLDAKLELDALRRTVSLPHRRTVMPLSNDNVLQPCDSLQCVQFRRTLRTLITQCGLSVSHSPMHPVGH